MGFLAYLEPSLWLKNPISEKIQKFLKKYDLSPQAKF